MNRLPRQRIATFKEVLFFVLVSGQKKKNQRDECDIQSCKDLKKKLVDLCLEVFDLLMGDRNTLLGRRGKHVLI